MEIYQIYPLYEYKNDYIKSQENEVNLPNKAGKISQKR